MSIADNLHFHRLDDGARVFTLQPPESVYVPVHMAADAAMGVLYQKAFQRPLTRWRCDGQGGASLLPICFDGWPAPDLHGPIAIVPHRGSSDSAGSFLVIGNAARNIVKGAPNLFVFELATMRLVHSHCIEGCGSVRALAADPAGSALVVLCDSLDSELDPDINGLALVLVWPLPGMAAAGGE